MSPLSLIFSSDEETSRALAQAFQELELTVELCPEIFSAVEKITAHPHEVVVCDCDEGAEAVFLLKTTHELKSNQAAFTIAITGPNTPERMEARPHLRLTKPVVAEQTKYALLTCDEFLAHMKGWLPQIGFPAPASDAKLRSWPKNKPTALPQMQSRARRSPQPSLPPLGTVDESKSPFRPGFGLADLLFPGTEVPGVVKTRATHAPRAAFKPGLTNSWLRVTALAVVFLSVGYVFSEPLRSESVAASVAVMCGRALERTQSWFHSSDVEAEPSPTLAARKANSGPVDHIAVALPHHSKVANAMSSSEPSAPAEDEPRTELAQLQPPKRTAAAAQPRIPESLKAPLHALDPRNMASAIGPSLLATLEPISLPEELAQKLLLAKVQPSYPEQALRAGMQGPVVLQAWIARDGTIRDLKLVRGSFLLGQAAYQAVKQWRYQPYLLNGKPVEAQTLVTIDFRLP
ncbi:MAG TPA: energy transducer TonB [Terriglobales bacterium]|nr:energy transducer TonB [Terriglobales bacterium]